MLRPLAPSSVRAPFARYSHGIEVPPGARLVFCSGQLGMSPNDDIPFDPAIQAGLCFANIAAILAAAGMTLADIVRLNAFAADREAMTAYMTVRDSLVADPPPASTLMLVSGFTRPEFRIEVEAIAAKAAP